MAEVKLGLMLHLTALIALCFTISRSQESDLLPYTYPTSPVPNTTSLYFGLLQSFGGEYVSSGSIPGVQLALDYINDAQVLLPGYTLRYILRDSQVSCCTVHSNWASDLTKSVAILSVQEVALLLIASECMLHT